MGMPDFKRGQFREYRLTRAMKVGAKPAIMSLQADAPILFDGWTLSSGGQSIEFPSFRGAILTGLATATQEAVK